MENKEEGKIPIDEITKSIKAIKYGQVHITIHNSEVVQIDKIEKIRIDKVYTNTRLENNSITNNQKK